MRTHYGTSAFSFLSLLIPFVSEHGDKKRNELKLQISFFGEIITFSLACPVGLQETLIIVERPLLPHETILMSEAILERVLNSVNAELSFATADR